MPKSRHRWDFKAFQWFTGEATSSSKNSFYVLSFLFDIAYAKRKEMYQRKEKHRFGSTFRSGVAPLKPCLACGTLSKKKVGRGGFTLAEVLITLTIIGVIAALTIPNLYAKYEKQQTIAGLKKMYSTLNQAFIELEKDEPDFTIDYAFKDMDMKLRPYLKIQEKCNTNIDNNVINNKNCKLIYKNMPNCSDTPKACGIGFTSYYAFVILADGSQIMYGNQGMCGNQASIAVDINGIKPPNTWGKDVFAFQYNTKKEYPRRLLPYYYGSGNICGGLSTVKREDIQSGYQRGCSQNGKMLNCTALIMYDNWQIKDDYPW